MSRLNLDANEWAALTSALDSYTEGFGMDPDDEDAATLDAILSRLTEGP